MIFKVIQIENVPISNIPLLLCFMYAGPSLCNTSTEVESSVGDFVDTDSDEDVPALHALPEATFHVQLVVSDGVTANLQSWYETIPWDDNAAPYVCGVLGISIEDLLHGFHCRLAGKAPQLGALTGGACHGHTLQLFVRGRGGGKRSSQDFSQQMSLLFCS